MIRIGPRTIIIYIISILNKAKTLFTQLMRTYVWNLTDLFDDNRLESLTAIFLQIINTGLIVRDVDHQSLTDHQSSLGWFTGLDFFVEYR